MQHFPEFREPSAEFFNISPILPNGEDLTPIRCFQNKEHVYAMAESNMVRTVLEQLIENSQNAQAKTLYIAVTRDLPNFLTVFRILAYVGFKQVPPEIQISMCTAPAVLMQMNLDS